MATVEKRKHWVIIYQNKINSKNARIVRQYHSIPTTPALILKSHNKIPLRDYSIYGDFKYFGRMGGTLIYKTKTVKGFYLVMHIIKPQ